MSEIKHGSVTVAIPEGIEIPAAAGTLSAVELSRVPRAPRAVGEACLDAADSLEKAGSAFVAPAGVTPDSLRKAGIAADEIDRIIASVEVVLGQLRQANLLLDAEAWEQLRKVNDMVLAQSKTSPEILGLFAPLRAFMTRGR